MLEIGTYGTVRGEGGNILTYSDTFAGALIQQNLLKDLTYSPQRQKGSP
jgi:hypothetical protein